MNLIDNKLLDFIKNSPSVLPPEVAPHQLDSFAISGYPHYENVLSNWFVFFLNTAGEHGFSNLFPEAIKKCLTEKYGIEGLDWLDNELKSEREIITKNKKFIDIIVFDEGDSNARKFDNCLIIEHKVNADLYNELDEYYKSINVENFKLGIILSAKNREDNLTHFKNISYAELLSSIRLLLGKYQPQANYKFILYLTDLLINMDKLSDNVENSKALNFCFEYGTEVDKIVKLKIDADSQLVEQVKIAISDSIFIFRKSYGSSFSLKNQADGVSIHIKMDDLFTKNTFYYEFWLKDKWSEKWSTVEDDSKIRAFCEKNGLKGYKKAANKTWNLISKGDYFYDRNSELNFGEQVHSFLDEKFNPLIDLIEITINQNS
ncbi:PD-(D/E)XK nuclease superfamily protein [Spirosomataceae bacterium TFI 002]|nr:PD-(D/E)XK nuclease superfamily protein [Spirosomataceae bacterium TFI 002]